MRSQRVTKLLACTLSSAMIVMPVPVFASSSTPQTTVIEGDSGVAGGSFTTDFDVTKEKVKVTVPVNANIRVNPNFKNGNMSVNGFRVASKDLVIANQTLDSDHNAMPVLVTAYAKILSKTDNVKVYYDPAATTYTASSNSRAKEMRVQLVSENGNGDVSSNNGQYTLGTTFADSATHSMITTMGSLLEVPVPAPTSVNNAGTASAAVQTAGYASFAVIGDANENADWQKDDAKFEISYDIRATSSPSVVNKEAITFVNANYVSTNSISVNIPDKALEGVDVAEVMVRDDLGKWDEWVVGEDPNVYYERNANDDGEVLTFWYESIQDYDEILTASGVSKPNKLEVIIAFTDGRVWKGQLSK